MRKHQCSPHIIFHPATMCSLAKQERATLLNYTGYVQWVPQVGAFKGFYDATKP